MKLEQQPIDFVLIWVDGNDIEWRKEKAKYLPSESNDNQYDASDMRYRDWDNLKYWFRAVEKYAPWVNRIHFVTCGHYPEWLNLKADKLNLVSHKEFIPEKYLPTFSSHPIELNLHRISDLSEQFVYFNDDLFITAPVEPKDFFVNGLPCDSLEETPLAFHVPTQTNQISVNTILFANRFFDRKENRRNQWRKWYNIRDPHVMIKNLLLGILNDKVFLGLNTHHLPQAYRKGTLKKVWSVAPELLDNTCTHKFRDVEDVNQYVFKFWHLLKGEFHPYNKKKFGKFYSTGNGGDDICNAIITGKYKAICINDSIEVDFEEMKRKVNASFEEVFPEKSSFEL